MLYNVGLVSAVQQSKSAIPIHGAAAKLLQSCLALCDPMDCSVHGISQEYWSGLPFSSPGDLSDPGLEPTSPALQADSLPLNHCLSVQFSCSVMSEPLRPHGLQHASLPLPTVFTTVLKIALEPVGMCH